MRLSYTCIVNGRKLIQGAHKFGQHRAFSSFKMDLIGCFQNMLDVEIDKQLACLLET